jgi:hypothetical protein
MRPSKELGRLAAGAQGRWPDGGGLGEAKTAPTLNGASGRELVYCKAGVLYRGVDSSMWAVGPKKAFIGEYQKLKNV